MMKNGLRMAALFCLAAPLTSAFADTNWKPDSRIAQPAATNYCLNGVCLGMPLNQLPTVLSALSPEQGHWAEEEDESARLVPRLITMRNPCAGDIHDLLSMYSDEKNLIFWTGVARERMPFLQALAGARETLLRQPMEVTVAAVAKTRKSNESIFVVTRIKTRLTFSPDQAGQILTTFSTAWPRIKAVPGRFYIDHFTDSSNWNAGRSTLTISPVVVADEAENAVRFKSGNAEAEFTWHLPRTNDSSQNSTTRFGQALSEQPFCARPARSTVPMGDLLK